MENAKHTKGNWATEYDGAIVMDGQIVSPPIGKDSDSPETKKANSHLIAAAPELLEALKRTVNLLNGIKGFISNTDRSIDWSGDTIVPQANAAIIKSEGRA